MVFFLCILGGLVFVIVWAVAREALKHSAFSRGPREALAVCVGLLSGLSVLQPTNGSVTAVPLIIPVLLMPYAALAAVALLLLLLSGTAKSRSWRDALGRARRWLSRELGGSELRARRDRDTDIHKEEE